MPSQPISQEPTPLPSSTLSIEFVDPKDGAVVGRIQVTNNPENQIYLLALNDIPSGSVAILPTFLSGRLQAVDPPPQSSAPSKFSSFDHK